MTAADRRKGANGERELAQVLTDAGFPCARNARNGVSAEDIAHAIPGVWIECKRQENARIWQWLQQAEDAATALRDIERTPVVVFRRSRSKWYACLPLDDLLEYWKGPDRGDD